jgi:putative (di)nucleoside polyphosphate hydrolase
VIDDEGFRQNVGIILVNKEGQLFWGKRVGQEAWQFPQGGINEHEDGETALFRELQEEVGVEREHVSIIAESTQWLTYRLPKRLIRGHTQPVCVGQKQKWFLLRLTGDDSAIKLDLSIKPEFDHWRWVSYWFPLFQVVNFKREVYRQALLEFAPKVMSIHHTGIILDPLDR